MFCAQLRLLEGADDQMDLERQGSVRQVSGHFNPISKSVFHDSIAWDWKAGQHIVIALLN